MQLVMQINVLKIPIAPASDVSKRKIKTLPEVAASSLTFRLLSPGETVIFRSIPSKTDKTADRTDDIGNLEQTSRNRLAFRFAVDFQTPDSLSNDLAFSTEEF